MRLRLKGNQPRSEIAFLLVATLANDFSQATDTMEIISYGSIVGCKKRFSELAYFNIYVDLGT